MTHAPIFRSFFSLMMDMSYTGTVVQENDGKSELKEKSTLSSLAYILPPEVLCEIFQAFIQSPTKLSSSSFRWHSHSNVGNGPRVRSTFNGDSPIILGQVCQFWRQVVLGTSMLWSNLYVEDPIMQFVPLTQLWLERAGSCLLTLVLHDNSGSACLKATSSIFSLFIQRSRYWKKIDFNFFGRGLGSNVGYETLANVVDELDWDGCPNLESASIMAFKWDQVALNKFWMKLHRSQALYHVDWSLTFKGSVPVHAPLKQLRHVTMESTSLERDILFMLKECPDLVSLHVSFSSFSWSPLDFSPQTQTTINHPHLQKMILDINVESNSDVPLLFDNLTLPALKSLEIRNESLLVDRDVVQRVEVAVKGCLDRSNCVLEEFGLDRSIVEMEYIYEDYNYNINTTLDSHIPDILGQLHL